MERDGVVLKGVELTLGAQQFRFDCRLPAGRVTAVAGPSGSGKTTLLNLIAGFEQPSAGHVLINGEDVSGRHPARRPVSLIFQDHNLFAHLDLFTNIGLGIEPSLKLSSDEKGLISSALVRVGLGGFEKRKPGTLSGGERQRAAFARALVRKKPLLLLDEPFAALDPGLRAEMADLLLELHRESGNTVVFVSHDPEEVKRLADQLVFLDRGRVVAQGQISAYSDPSGHDALDRFFRR